ncbi:hypothetical protein VOLCADRAFT_89015 [Volvox carteri f. nagariensis]|uniref:Uncharacterized protein n=1 Tax=Volvox carteri f. nagariensis TaxID=3068 RepID=D8TQK2_VOLCA|nr:uncharacterized protein VOLCADRAFT_89015 [Volvox carteri f. nagariensis]EFJ50168.1 hypothetical protein VOLCADRAFT_89015 [Volvox carteri f. nagariensis]|eukprot:XP_002948788.1 hypothetical protein VOLCADRAFT_89015 [Volvox carteri f. nagariensis]
MCAAGTCRPCDCGVVEGLGDHKDTSRSGAGLAAPGAVKELEVDDDNGAVAAAAAAATAPGDLSSREGVLPLLRVGDPELPLTVSATGLMSRWRGRDPDGGLDDGGGGDGGCGRRQRALSIKGWAERRLLKIPLSREEPQRPIGRAVALFWNMDAKIYTWLAVSNQQRRPFGDMSLAVDWRSSRSRKRQQDCCQFWTR